MTLIYAQAMKVTDAQLLAAHEQCRSVRLAAAQLGISRNTMYVRLKKLGVQPYVIPQDRHELGRLGAAGLHAKYGADTWKKGRQRFAESFETDNEKSEFYRRLRAIPPKPKP